MPMRLGDVVATTSGKLYTVQHVTADGRLHLYGLEVPRRTVWARNARLHRTWELASVHLYLDDAERRHAQGYPDLAHRAIGSASQYLERAVARGQDSDTLLEGARARLAAVRSALSTLEV